MVLRTCPERAGLFAWGRPVKGGTAGKLFALRGVGCGAMFRSCKV